MDVKSVLKNVSRKKSGGAKKIGRSLKKCAVYKSLGTREKNKARKAHREVVKAAKLARKRERRV